MGHFAFFDATVRIAMVAKPSDEQYKKRTNTGDDVFIRIQALANTSDVPPTAVLLGWFASQPKHVYKYAALYEQMGYHVVYTTAPASVVFPVSPRVTIQYVLSILRIIAKDRRLTNGGILFHMFSNGGAICAPYLSQILTASAPDVVRPDDQAVVKIVRESMCGVVFDSAPVKLASTLGASAICDGFSVSNQLIRFLVWFLFSLLCLLQRIFVVNLNKEFWNGIRVARYFGPETYIYSRADRLLDVPALEQMIQVRKNDGCNVNVLAVDDSPHVKIFVQYPQRYREALIKLHVDGVNQWRVRQQLPLWSFSRGRQADGII